MEGSSWANVPDPAARYHAISPRSSQERHKTKGEPSYPLTEAGNMGALKTAQAPTCASSTNLWRNSVTRPVHYRPPKLRTASASPHTPDSAPSPPHPTATHRTTTHDGSIPLSVHVITPQLGIVSIEHV